MSATLRILLVVLSLTGLTSLALARTTPIEAGEVSSSLPAATSLFRHVTATGSTKPLGSALDGRLGTSPFLEAADKRLDRVIRTVICHGC